MSELTKRLRQLSDAVTREDWKEFSMRVPAEPQRDADIVLVDAADRLAELERENEALRKDAERFRSLRWRYKEDRDMGPGASWYVYVHTNNTKIRSNCLAVIDAALKEQSKC